MAQKKTNSQLKYSRGKKEMYSPIPPWEAELQTVEAEYFKHVTDERMHVEGLCFDRDGNLYFVSVQYKGAYRIDMKTKEITQIYESKEMMHTAIKIHKNGRIYLCGIGEGGNSGGILSMNPDGSDAQWVIRGYNVDDMVFDKDGGFYFNSFIGQSYNPTGAIFYVSPDGETIKNVISNLASPNGIALSMNQSVLWVTEHTGQTLLKIPVASPGVVGPYPYATYRFVGSGGADSISIDEDDNLYIAMFGQGRVMVFNNAGFPIANVMIPNRDKGHNLCSSHAMIKPGTKELYICACDDYGYGNQDRESEGTWIFKAGSFGLGNRTAYQFS